MGNEPVLPWSDAVMCDGCGHKLLPLSYSSPPTDNGAARVENRPDLKCPGCGQCYQWQDFAGWAPAGFPTTMSPDPRSAISAKALRGRAPTMDRQRARPAIRRI
jgi:hypothetical protein